MTVSPGWRYGHTRNVIPVIKLMGFYTMMKKLINKSYISIIAATLLGGSGATVAATYSQATPVKAYVDISGTIPAPIVTYTPMVVTDKTEAGKILGTLTMTNVCSGCNVIISDASTPRQIPASEKTLSLEGNNEDISIPFDMFDSNDQPINGMITSAGTGTEKVILKTRSNSALPLPGRYSKTLYVIYSTA